MWADTLVAFERGSGRACALWADALVAFERGSGRACALWAGTLAAVPRGVAFADHDTFVAVPDKTRDAMDADGLAFGAVPSRVVGAEWFTFGAVVDVPVAAVNNGAPVTNWSASGGAHRWKRFYAVAVARLAVGAIDRGLGSSWGRGLGSFRLIVGRRANVDCRAVIAVRRRCSVSGCRITVGRDAQCGGWGIGQDGSGVASGLVWG